MRLWAACTARAARVVDWAPGVSSKNRGMAWHWRYLGHLATEHFTFGWRFRRRYRHARRRQDGAWPWATPCPSQGGRHLQRCDDVAHDSKYSHAPAGLIGENGPITFARRGNRPVASGTIWLEKPDDCDCSPVFAAVMMPLVVSINDDAVESINLRGLIETGLVSFLCPAASWPWFAG